MFTCSSLSSLRICCFPLSYVIINSISLVFRLLEKQIKQPETHKLYPNDNRGNTITGNTFTTNPALSPQWLVLHANQDERMSLLLAPSDQGFQQSLETIVVSFFCPVFPTLSESNLSVGVCRQNLESLRSKLGSTNTFWSSVRRWKLSHVWGSSAGNSLAVSWLAVFLVCGSVIEVGLRHALADLGL